MATTTAPTAGLDRYFKISERGSSVRTEIIAGLATWLTMAYILFVNPQILGFVGIADLEPLGLPFKEVLTVRTASLGSGEPKVLAEVQGWAGRRGAGRHGAGGNGAEGEPLVAHRQDRPGLLLAEQRR
jgi:hypothetical protein